MAYLMAHFIGEQIDGEQIYFSVSKDGLYWKDLSINPVLRSPLGEKGVRDPFIIKCPKTDKYFMIATDLRIQAGKGWHVAQYEGSKDLIIWESSDLVNWSAPRKCRVAVEEAGCAWAPESIYDVEKEAFFVFWASMVKLDEDVEAKQRIYGSYTTDFMTFTEPFIYAKAAHHLIDMTIIYENGWYYRFVKDETTKLVKMDKVKSLQDSTPVDIEVHALDGHLVEGPQTYQLPDGRWCLIVDRFVEGKGYLPLVCTDLEKGDFEVVPESDYDFGKLKKRHGSVIEITGEEMRRLVDVFGSKE